MQPRNTAHAAGLIDNLGVVVVCVCVEQDAYDLFLGNYVVGQSPRSPFAHNYRPVATTLVPRHDTPHTTPRDTTRHDTHHTDLFLTRAACAVPVRDCAPDRCGDAAGLRGGAHPPARGHAVHNLPVHGTTSPTPLTLSSHA
jgi:hypothetical protein